jgi:hypothetical protein
MATAATQGFVVGRCWGPGLVSRGDLSERDDGKRGKVVRPMSQRAEPWC